MPTQVLVPPLGQTVDTMNFVAWLKQEGEFVRQGEALYVIETDKAMLDVEAPATGVLANLTAKSGDEVKALAPIAVIVGEDKGASQAAEIREDAPEGARQERGGAEEAGRPFVSPRARRLAESEGVPLDLLDATGPEDSIVERDVRAYLDEREAATLHAAQVAASAAQETLTPAVSPLARRLAGETGVDLAAVTGTGPRGQITREDVEAAVAGRGGRAPLPASPDLPLEVIPFAGPRKVIAERMSASSRDTAPVTLTAEADATALVQLRDKLLSDGVAASYNDLMLYALARALRQHPRLNTSLDDEGVKVWREVRIGLAVDTDRGLLVPVLRKVGEQGLAELASKTVALVERARAGKCAPDELRGGTFTLTNLGMFGIDAFTPIINLPECAILGVGRIKTEPSWIGDHVEPRQRVWLSLTFDHRLVDGGPAARFLATVVRLVEKPHLLLA